MNTLGRSRGYLLSLTLLVAALFAGRSTAQSLEAAGKLNIYGTMTQTGIVAKREFVDEQDRVYKTIYYTAVTHAGGSAVPYLEKYLREQSVVMYSFDESNCMIREENNEPPGQLASVIERKCWPRTSTPELTIYRDRLGIRERETTRSGTLYFSSDGKNVVAMNASLPQETDLMNGWGDQQDGMAVGIAVNQPRGKQRELRVYRTIKNTNRVSDKTIWISPLEYELTDRSGRVVPYRGPLQKGQNVPDVENCPGRHAINAPRHGTANSARPIDLMDNYDALPAGPYRFRIKLCVSGAAKPLVSNSITFEVTE